jgi:two-component system sensor histidine kinase/response regulator
VDAADGLARVAGNARLLRSLLERFAADQAGAAAEIARALEGGDRKTAERVAHTVKGVAGNLGMRTIHASAGKLERALRDGSAETPAALSAFAASLGPQVEAIRRALGSGTAPPAAASGGAFDAGAARAAIGRLRRLLASSDGGAPDAFAELARALAGRVGGPALDALGKAIGDFDFEGALSRLESVAAESGAGEESA